MGKAARLNWERREKAMKEGSDWTSFLGSGLVFGEPGKHLDSLSLFIIVKTSIWNKVLMATAYDHLTIAEHLVVMKLYFLTLAINSLDQNPSIEKGKVFVRTDIDIYRHDDDRDFWEVMDSRYQKINHCCVIGVEVKGKKSLHSYTEDCFTDNLWDRSTVDSMLNKHSHLANSINLILGELN